MPDPTFIKEIPVPISNDHQTLITIIISIPRGEVLGNRAVLCFEEQLVEHVGLDAFFQRPAQFSYSAAMKALLHLPALQHLMDLLSQAVAGVIVLDRVHVDLGQAQFPRTDLPLPTYVLPG